MEIINNIIENVKNIIVNKKLEVILVLALIILLNMFSSGISYLIIKLFNIKEKDKKKIKSNSFYTPLKRFIRILPIYLAFSILNVSFMNYIDKIFKVITIILIAQGIAGLFDVESTIVKKIKDSNKFDKSDEALAFICKSIKVIIYIIAAYIILLEFDYNLSGIITGLGLGSVVIAFAAQDIAKNIFAGLSIFVDRPFEIGDFIECGTYIGTVEDIKFRTTKIRTLENTVITIPNTVLTNGAINNYNSMQKRRFSLDLGLVMSTPSDTIEKITNRIKFALENHKNVIENSVVVSFNKITQDSMNLMIYLYTDVTDYEEFLKFSQEINIIIMEIVEKEEIGLAYPSQDIYIRNVK